MMTDDELARLRKEVGDGREVAALIGNETVKRIFDGLIQGRQNAWLEELDSANREVIWLEVRGAVLLWDALKSIVNSGRFAEVQLANEAAMRKENG